MGPAVKRNRHSGDSDDDYDPSPDFLNVVGDLFDEGLDAPQRQRKDHKRHFNHLKNTIVDFLATCSDCEDKSKLEPLVTVFLNGDEAQVRVPCPPAGFVLLQSVEQALRKTTCREEFLGLLNYLVRSILKKRKRAKDRQQSKDGPSKKMKTEGADEQQSESRSPMVEAPSPGHGAVENENETQKLCMNSPSSRDSEVVAPPSRGPVRIVIRTKSKEMKSDRTGDPQLPSPTANSAAPRRTDDSRDVSGKLTEPKLHARHLANATTPDWNTTTRDASLNRSTCQLPASPPSSSIETQACSDNKPTVCYVSGHTAESQVSVPDKSSLDGRIADEITADGVSEYTIDPRPPTPRSAVVIAPDGTENTEYQSDDMNEHQSPGSPSKRDTHSSDGGVISETLSEHTQRILLQAGQMNDEAAKIPIAKWQAYSHRLADFCESKDIEDMGFDERMKMIKRMIYIDEEAEVIASGEWDRLTGVARLCVYLREMTGSDVDEDDTQKTDKWLSRHLKDIRWLKKTLGRKERIINFAI